jgi:hypothetical protein
MPTMCCFKIGSTTEYGYSRTIEERYPLNKKCSTDSHNTHQIKIGSNHWNWKHSPKRNMLNIMVARNVKYAQEMRIVAHAYRNCIQYIGSKVLTTFVQLWMGVWTASTVLSCAVQLVLPCGVPPGFPVVMFGNWPRARTKRQTTAAQQLTTVGIPRFGCTHQGQLLQLIGHHLHAYFEEIWHCA